MPTADEEQEIVGRHEVVEVVGLSDTARVEAKMDTGANRTTIDEELACEIGAGPLVERNTFRGSAGGQSRRLVVELTVRLYGNTHEIEASIADRSDLTTDVRLGCDALETYLIDVGSD